MDFDLEHLRPTFLEECVENLGAMERGFLRMERGETDPAVVEEVFRAAHTLKGNASIFECTQLVALTHRLETLLDQVRSRTRQLDSELVDIFLGALDTLRALVEAERGGGPVEQAHLSATRQSLDQCSPQGAKPACGWRLRFVPAAHLMAVGNDPVLMFRALGKLAPLQVKADVSALPDLEELEPQTCYLSWEGELRGDVPEDLVREVFEWVEDDSLLELAPLLSQAEIPYQPLVETTESEVNTLRVEVDKVERLVNMVGELVITHSILARLAGDGSQSAFQDAMTLLGQNIRQLQDSVLQVRMVPVAFAFQRLPRLVRDLSRRLGKSVELKMYGESTELDKTVLERIMDPLLHIVRNSLDHGMETPEARLQAGKREQGLLEVRAGHHNGNLVLEIVDDGAGIDLEKLERKARQRGLSTDGMSRERLLDLIFESGFSTADQVNEISGRGVGMDVVRRNVQDLGGSVTLDSSWGRGTRVTLRLPLTLAILDGQLARVGGEVVVFPLLSIVECLLLNPSELRTLAGGQRLYRFRQEYLPILPIQESPNFADGSLLVVAEGMGERVGLPVDELMGQQQVVVKSLERNFRRIQGVLGATILGDGRVALILDVAGLVQNHRRGTPLALGGVA